MGVLDAPQLKGSLYAPGKAQTRIISGACQAIDDAGHVWNEEQRLAQLAFA